MGSINWRQIALAIALIVSMFSLGAVVAQDVPVGVENVEFVEWVTGPESPNQPDVNYDVDGTDLGSMFELDGTVYIAMGDTFGCCRPPEGGSGGANWRNNVVAYSTDRDLSDGMTIDGMLVNRRGRARLILPRSP